MTLTERYVREHFDELRKHCPGLTPERVLSVDVELVRVGRRPVGFIALETTEKAARIVALFLERRAPAGVLDHIAGRVIAWANKCELPLEFDTTRKGWVRRLERYGFRPLPYFRMTRSVSHG